MGRRNDRQQREQRKTDAKHRKDTYDMEYGPVEDREAKRGYPAKLQKLQSK